MKRISSSSLQKYRPRKPKRGFGHVLHIALQVLVPVLLFVLVRAEFEQIAFALVLLSKWRIFVVRPRHWPALLRASSVDAMFGLSVVAFMLGTSSTWVQLGWTAAYMLWNIHIKPRSSLGMIALQAFIAQTMALMALFGRYDDASTWVLTLLVGLITYGSAAHFFSGHEEPHSKLFGYTWAFFAASITWVLAHWMIFYGVIAQITLLLTLLGASLGAMYMLEARGRLSKTILRQFVFVLSAAIMVVLAFSDWSNKTT